MGHPKTRKGQGPYSCPSLKKLALIFRGHELPPHKLSSSSEEDPR